LVTDGLPALMLSFSPRHPYIMGQSPEKEMILLKQRDQSYIFLVGMAGAVLVILSYFIFSKWFNSGLGGTAAFSVLTMIQSFVFIDLWLSHRHIRENLLQLFSPLFVIAFIIPLAFQFIILSHPTTAGFFKISSVSIPTYLQFVVISFMVLIGIRVVKKLVRL
jgi:magnesium-transporting ATPase (P-type)